MQLFCSLVRLRLLYDVYADALVLLFDASSLTNVRLFCLLVRLRLPNDVYADALGLLFDTSSLINVRLFCLSVHLRMLYDVYAVVGVSSSFFIFLFVLALVFA